jgi:hypothetical protein
MKTNIERLLILIILSVICPTSYAQTIIDGISYKLDKETKTAVVNNGDIKYSGDIVIPKTVTKDGVRYDINGIAGGAFDFCTSVTSVTIPNSVTTIGDNAFNHCTSLTSIVIPNSVTSVGEYAFDGCENLVSVTLSNAITSIEFRIFMDCVKLKDINIPESTISIEDEAFEGCSALRSINLPNSIETLGNHVFRFCSSLESIVIPEKVTILPSAIFQGCSSLKKVTLPESLTEIRDQAFYECDNLEDLTIPASVRKIGSSPIDWTYNIKINNYSAKPQIIDYYNPNSYFFGELHVPVGFKAAYQRNDFWKKFTIIDDLVSPFVPMIANGVNFILNTKTKQAAVTDGDTKYQGDIVIPATVDYKGTTYKITSISERSFYGCDQLTSVSIPESMTNFEDGLFSGCKNLKTIISMIKKPTSLSINCFDPFSFDKITVHVPVGYQKYYQDDNVYCWNAFKIIEDQASDIFKEEIGGLRYYLYTMTKEAEVITGSKKYSGKVIIPASVTHKGVSYTVTSIADKAFWNNTMTSVTIPATVTKIGYEALAFYLPEEDSKADIYILSKKPQEIEYEAISLMGNNVIHVPVGYLKEYKNDKSWNKDLPWYRYQIVDDIEHEGVIKVEDNGINYYLILEKKQAKLTASPQKFHGDVVIPTSVIYKGVSYNVTSIGREAFIGSTDITSLTIPRYVEFIDCETFVDCIHLATVYDYSFTPQVLPGNVFDVYNELHVPTGCGEAYFWAHEWNSFNVIDDIANDLIVKVTNADKNYYLNKETKEVKLTTGVTPYSGDVVIPSTITYNGISYDVTSISRSAFLNCSDVTSVTIPSTIKKIDDNAFADCINLTSIKNYSPSPQQIEENTFVDSFIEIHVPAGCKATYLAAKYWENFTIIDDLPAVTTGIESIDARMNNDNIFSISGLHMSKQVKGLNIINGKKVIVK